MTTSSARKREIRDLKVRAEAYPVTRPWGYKWLHRVLLALDYEVVSAELDDVIDREPRGALSVASRIEALADDLNRRMDAALNGRRNPAPESPKIP